MKKILEKYLDGNCTQPELDEAVAILNGEMGETVVDDFMHNHWRNTPLNSEELSEEKFDLALHKIHHQINISEKRESLIKRIYIGFSKVAAVIMIPLMIATAFYYNENENEKDEVEAFTSMSVPAGVQSEIELPDGSKVWLNSASHIKFPTSFRGKDNRQIELHGEAYFEVAPDKEHPFMVNASDITVEVLGTSFNVSAYDDDAMVSIALVEGSVQLMSYVSGEKEKLTEMVPMQVAHYLKDGKDLSLKTEKNLNHYVAWKERKLVYVNEPFESVFKRMSRRYDVDYTMLDDELLKYRITGTFINESLDGFLKIIAMSTPIEYSIIPGEKTADGSNTRRKVLVHSLD